MNILENLYYGNISPCEQFIRPDSQIQKTMQKRDDIEAALNSSFTDEQKRMFDQYLMLSGEILDACCLNSFITGFRLGSGITYEAFVSTYTPYSDMTKDKTES